MREIGVSEMEMLELGAFLGAYATLIILFLHWRRLETHKRSEADPRLLLPSQRSLFTLLLLLLLLIPSNRINGSSVSEYQDK